MENLNQFIDKYLLALETSMRSNLKADCVV
jgi:hypothetical protein